MDEMKKDRIDRESLFMAMVRNYLPYWPWFLVSALVFSGLAIAYMRYAKPLYQATASLIIKDEKKGNEDSKLMESLNLVASKKIIENEVEVLKSRRVIDSVVKRLMLYAPVYREGEVKDISAYNTSPVKILFEQIDSIPGIDHKVYFTIFPDKNILRIENGRAYPLDQWVKTPWGVAKFLSTGNFSKDSNERYYFRLVKKEDATEQIVKRLKVTATNKLSSVIDMKYKDELPELSEDILNQIILAYNGILLDEKNSLAKNTLSFIESRLAIVGADMDLIEKKIQQYKGASGAVDIGTQGQLFLQHVSNNDQRVTELNMQLSVIDQLESQLASESNIAILPGSLGLTDPALSQLMGSLNTYQSEKERLQKTVAENNPILVSVNDQISAIKSRISENLKTYKKSIEAGRNNIAAASKMYNGMLQSIPQQEKVLLEISRDKAIKTGIYSFLLQKREESELLHASKISESRLVNYAQASPDPVSPNPFFVIGAWFFAVFGLPMAVVGAREAMGSTVLYRQEIEQHVSYPVLGELAHNKNAKAIVIEKGVRSLPAEEFRKLRYSLRHMGGDKPPTKILITSSISGEGKSFVAANLAISYSLTGKKVVLVDFDLHNSSLGDVFSEKERIGVTDYLSGDAAIDDILTPVAAYPDLVFINAGLGHPNPSELIEGQKIERMFESLESQFDIIVVDAAPVVLISDAHILSSYCDTTLYVIRHGYTPKSFLKRFDILNTATPLKNTHMVFNGIKPRGYLKSIYGYGYGYVYGNNGPKNITGKALRIAG